MARFELVFTKKCGSRENEVFKSWKNRAKSFKAVLGTMNFGSYTNEKDSYEIMDRALELGINFFDTANVYGNIMQKV